MTPQEKWERFREIVNALPGDNEQVRAWWIKNEMDALDRLNRESPDVPSRLDALRQYNEELWKIARSYPTPGANQTERDSAIYAYGEAEASDQAIAIIEGADPSFDVAEKEDRAVCAREAVAVPVPSGEALELDRYRLAVKMAADVMATDPRDWSRDRTDAWIWALIVGWDDEAEQEIVRQHGSAMHGACSLGRSLHDGGKEKGNDNV